MNSAAHFKIIAEAISYLVNDFKSQPNLDTIAEMVHLSPFHFQRVFQEWAGVSPKTFLQFLTVEYARKQIINEALPLTEIAENAGLSGTGRLHDLFIKTQAMTPGEYRNGGDTLDISYSFATSPFGEILVASTPKGVCKMAFTDDKTQTLEELYHLFPNASFTNQSTEFHLQALKFFEFGNAPSLLTLHLKGTPFQLKVWEALLNIPEGKLTTYSHLANKIGHPKASRAVGSAVGANPIAVLIPCHRVIQSSGVFGMYHWSPARKAAIIGFEAASIQNR